MYLSMTVPPGRAEGPIESAAGTIRSRPAHSAPGRALVFPVRGALSRIVWEVDLSKWRSLALQGVLAAALLAGCGAIIIRTIPKGSSPPPPAVAHTASLLVDGNSRATFRLLTGTPELKIGMANLGATGKLLSVTAAAGSTVPQLRMTSGSGAAGALVGLSVQNAPAITVILNSAVSWQLDLAGGTKQTVADLRGGQVTGIAVTKGSDVISLLLARPHGSVLVRLAAGASELSLSLPPGVQARVTAGAGAAHITLDGLVHTGVPAGSVFTTPGWTLGAAGFDVDATAGAARITVTTQAS
jgi:hypothetical protein